ncbi:MAG: transposase [Planctomycetes bacterium]|nr:transposase [Planctomycetota bacterium]
MPRLKRIAKGNIVYHVLNRANGRLRIFKKRRDFEAFEEILAEGAERLGMRICGYCIMSNHWHLVLWPRRDGDLSEFMKWVTVTHSHRWHTAHGTVGVGHLYQGRFKSFPVESSRYYLTLMRYVEANALRAGVVERSADWPWSSLAIRMGQEKAVVLSKGPMELPKRWVKLVDKAVDIADGDRELVETCIKRGRPMGEKEWMIRMAARLGLEATLRPRGRPRKGV